MDPIRNVHLGGVPVRLIAVRAEIDGRTIYIPRALVRRIPGEEEIATPLDVRVYADRASCFDAPEHAARKHLYEKALALV